MQTAAHAENGAGGHSSERLAWSPDAAGPCVTHGARAWAPAPRTVRGASWASVSRSGSRGPRTVSAEEAACPRSRLPPPTAVASECARRSESGQALRAPQSGANLAIADGPVRSHRRARRPLLSPRPSTAPPSPDSRNDCPFHYSRTHVLGQRMRVDIKGAQFAGFDSVPDDDADDGDNLYLLSTYQVLRWQPVYFPHRRKL